MRLAFLLSALAFGLAGCSGVYNLLAPPTATPAPSATPAPTATPAETATPSGPISPLAHVTIVLPDVMPTYDLSAPEAFRCRVRVQAVRSGTKFAPRERFDMAWKVDNVGSALWDPDRVQFTHYSGSKLYVSPVSRLQERVDPGATTLLVTDMRAPATPGDYSTTWALRYGSTDFCHVSVSIKVR
jgi:hypothetical protein